MISQPHNVMARFLSAAMLATGIGSAACSEQPTPAAIFEAVRARFEAIQTIDIPSRSAWVWGEIDLDSSWTVDSAQDRAGENAKTVRVDARHVRQKGELFRYYIEMPEIRIELAYDGSRYQQFDPNIRSLHLMDESLFEESIKLLSYNAIVQFLSPYEFAAHVYGNRTLISLKLLQSRSFWDSLAAMSNTIGEETLGDQTCVVVEIENTDHKQYGRLRTRAYFAQDLAYFPIRYELYIGEDIFCRFEAEAEGVREPASCKKRPDDKPPIYVAARSVVHQFDSMGSGRPKGGVIYEIDVERARVNCEIPDEFFTIAPSEALFVMDDRPTD